MFQGSVCLHVCQYGLVADALNQTCAEHRLGNAENDVVHLLHLFEVGLSKDASGRIAPAADGEDGMYTPVWSVRNAVGTDCEGEARFPNGSSGRDEVGDGVGGTVCSACFDLGIGADVWVLRGRGTRTASRRLRVTTGATVGIESGSETVGHLIHGLETIPTILEIFNLRACERRKRPACIYRAFANARILGAG